MTESTPPPTARADVWPAEGQLLVDAADDVTADTETRSLSRGVTRVELADGQTFVVTVDNRDFVRWDLTAQRQKWPSGQAVPFLFQTFLAWSAAKRGGLFAGTFDAWQDVCVLASMHDDEPANPTQ